MQNPPSLSLSSTHRPIMITKLMKMNKKRRIMTVYEVKIKRKKCWLNYNMLNRRQKIKLIFWHFYFRSMIGVFFCLFVGQSDMCSKAFWVTGYSWKFQESHAWWSHTLCDSFITQSGYHKHCVRYRFIGVMADARDEGQQRQRQYNVRKKRWLNKEAA